MAGVFVQLLKGDKRFLLGLMGACILVLLITLSWFSPYEARAWNVVPRDRPPSFTHLLGTTSLGQDVFWNATIATRNSVFLGMLTALMSTFIGTLVGLVAGYRGGRIDRVLTAINDSLLAIPTLPILILFAAIFRGHLSLGFLAILLAMLSWPWGGRQVRAMVLSLREREFTLTALFSGMGTFRIILGEHLPFTIPWVMANFINTINWAVGMEATLAVFGLSALDTPTIGTTIYWAVQYQAILRGRWWWVAAPLTVAVLLFISLYLLSVAIGKFLDPRTRAGTVRLEEKPAAT